MTPTPTNADDVTVRQEDREAAAPLFELYDRDGVLKGDFDRSETVKAFALHRIAHQSAEVERLREAVKEACDFAEGLIDAFDYVGTGNGRSAAIDEANDRAKIATLRAALAIKGE